MRILGTIVLLFTALPWGVAQGLHPLSDPDLMFGKVAQVKEIFYAEPKAGEKIDTLEKRITWYDVNGNTLDVQRFMHAKSGWVANVNEFSLRLLKFGEPPVTTGKDSLDFSIRYDTLGHELERDNYSADGVLSSKELFYYKPDGSLQKNEVYTGDNLFSITAYVYEQNRLTHEKVTFVNHNNYSINYRYEGADPQNNWLKRIRIINVADKVLRTDVTERRVICYP